MKKIISLITLLVLVVPVLTLSGCGENDGLETSATSSITSTINGTKYAQNPEGLDYSKDENWYIKPNQYEKTGSLDVFIIYPTIVADPNKPEFIPAQDEDMKKSAESWVNSVIRPIFDHMNVNIFMPKYRQYNGANFTKDSDYMRTYMKFGETPKKDIYNAFDYFVTNLLTGKGDAQDNYIMLGHSQGAALVGLLASDFATDYMKYTTKLRMKGAYMAGWGLTSTLYNDSPFAIGHSKPKVADKFGQIYSWNTVVPQELTSTNVPFTWGDDTTKAINPITFSNKDIVSTKGFKGQLLEDKDYKWNTNDQIKINDSIIGIAHGLDLTWFGDKFRKMILNTYGMYKVEENKAFRIEFL